MTSQLPGDVNGLPHSLFISDLHLCHSRPAITGQFLQFLDGMARHAEKLFVLGDLFEYWAGDDDMHAAHHAQLISAFKALSGDVDIYFIHGNRDFLLGQQFAEASGIQLLADPTLLTLYNRRVLISHGDSLCTDDVDYQAFRLQVREPSWQQSFLSQPLAQRKQHIEALRQRSEQEKSYKSVSIMDVNTQAVHAMLSDHQYPELLIHGHTHRPARHDIVVDGHACQRWVLGDWYEQGSCLRLDMQGVTALALHTTGLQTSGLQTS